MEDRIFDDADSLIEHLNGMNATDALDEVVAEVTEILKKHISSDIYGNSYRDEGAWVGGTTYEQRGHIADNITWKMEDDNTLLVTSKETANESLSEAHKFENRDDGAFLQLLESGHMGFVKKGFSRPAVTNAQKEVNNSSKIRSLINGGLKEKYS